MNSIGNQPRMSRTLQICAHGSNRAKNANHVRHLSARCRGSLDSHCMDWSKPDLTGTILAWPYIVQGVFHNLDLATPQDSSNNLLHYLLILLIVGVPVGLPVVTTTTLAVGAAYLAKEKAIVQKLTAIESLAVKSPQSISESPSINALRGLMFCAPTRPVLSQPTSSAYVIRTLRKVST